MLKRSGVNLLGLVTTSAVLTAVIGLALQNTISNLFAGLALQLDGMIGAGDWIKAGDNVGRVMQIKWRTTNLLTKDGDVVRVPNAELLSGRLINYNKPTPMHRVWLKVGFHYRHPPNTVKRVLLAAIQEAPGVLTEPPPDVVPLDFADSSILYALRYWITDFEADVRIDGEVRTRVWYAALRAGLEIPFPTRTVLMQQTDAEAAAAEARGRLEDRLALLARLELFSGLEDADRKLLAEGMKVARFAAGEVILRQDQPGDSLYLIQKGDVIVRLAVDGIQREVAALKTGQIFGEMSLITGEPRTATCLAKSDVLCYVIDHAAFQQVLDARPSIAEEISRTLGQRQTELSASREGLTAEAIARQQAEASSRLLARIRNFFHLD
jgi:CRP-like cAMP-binding protein